jgi:hypothetical protein
MAPGLRGSAIEPFVRLCARRGSVLQPQIPTHAPILNLVDNDPLLVIFDGT